MPRTHHTRPTPRPGVIRRGAAGVSRWVTGLASVAIVAGIGGAAAALEAIGPPPNVRVEAFWVHGHRDAVRVLVLCVGLVVAGIAAGVLLARRWTVIAAVAGLAWLAFWRHPESVSIIVRVLLRHWN